MGVALTTRALPDCRLPVAGVVRGPQLRGDDPATSAPEIHPRFRLLIHGADILWPALISLFTSGPNSPFFLFFLFVLLAAAYRWGLWETLATAIISIALLATETAVLSHSGTHHFGIRFQAHADQLLLISVYLMVMGLLLGYLAENEKQLRAEKAVVTRTLGHARVDLGLTGTLREIMGDLLSLFACSSALLVVEETHSSKLFACRASSSENSGTQFQWLDAGITSGKRIFRYSREYVVRERRSAPDKFLMLAVNSDGALRKPDWSFFSPLLNQHQFRAVLGVALATSEEWSGRLFLFEPRWLVIARRRFVFCRS